MANPFVWFDLRTPAKDAAQRFYSSLLNWQIDENGTMAAGAEPWGVVAAPQGWRSPSCSAPSRSRR